MKNKTALKTLDLLGFKNDQRKFLKTFGKLFLRLFFCNEWLDLLLIEWYILEHRLRLKRKILKHNCQY